MKTYLKLMIIPVALMCTKKTYGTCGQVLTAVELAKQNPEALKKDPKALGAFKRSTAATAKKLSTPLKVAHKKLGGKRFLTYLRKKFPKTFTQKCVQTPQEQEDLMVLSQFVKAHVPSSSPTGSMTMGGYRKSSVPDAPPMPSNIPAAPPMPSKMSGSAQKTSSSNIEGRKMTELERAVQNRLKRAGNRDRILGDLEQRNQDAFTEGGKSMVRNGGKPIGRHQKSMAQSLEEGDRKQGNLSKDQQIWHQEQARKEKAARDAELEALRGQGRVKNRNNL